jgi:hypothetical protein
MLVCKQQSQFLHAHYPQVIETLSSFGFARENRWFDFLFKHADQPSNRHAWKQELKEKRSKTSMVS